MLGINWGILLYLIAKDVSFRNQDEYYGGFGIDSFIFPYFYGKSWFGMISRNEFI